MAWKKVTECVHKWPNMAAGIASLFTHPILPLVEQLEWKWFSGWLIPVDQYNIPSRGSAMKSKVSFFKFSPVPDTWVSLTAFLGQRTALSTLRPRQNARYFPHDICKCIFLNENVWISIKISLFVPEGPINNTGSDNGLMPVRQQAIIWINDALVHWRIYASLSLNVLMSIPSKM